MGAAITPDLFGNDHTHKLNEPWDTIAHVRADLRQAKGLLRRALSDLREAIKQAATEYFATKLGPANG